MMSMQMMEAEKAQKTAEGKPAAASPVEKVVIRTNALSFAASGVKQN